MFASTAGRLQSGLNPAACCPELRLGGVHCYREGRTILPVVCEFAPTMGTL